MTTTTTLHPTTTLSPRPPPAIPKNIPPRSPSHLTRLSSRNQTHTTPTSGLCLGHIQTNLLVLPTKYAADFRLLCQRNPVACPLLASTPPGNHSHLTSHLPSIPDSALIRTGDLDLRHDLPRYTVYQSGTLIDTPLTLEHYWSPTHTAFLLGCSFSFEKALADAGLPAPHTLHARNVPMYRTNIPLCPAGVFEGSTHVVSMRVYRASEVERVREITRPYVATHGEPVAWGWEAVERIGIRDVGVPEWGDAPVMGDGRVLVKGTTVQGEEVVPVFWGCGVTPQEAVVGAGSRLQGTVLAHAPGHMLVLDLRDEDLLSGLA